MAQAPTPHNDTLRDYSPVLALSMAAHLVVLALLAFNLDLMPRKKPEPARLAIQATVVDPRALQQRAAQEERRARQAQEAAERRRREEAERERREEQRQAEVQRKAELTEKRKAQAEAEAKQKAEAETKRKAEAEVKQKAAAEAKRKAATEAKQKAAAEAKRKAAAEAKQKAADEVRRKADAEAKRKADADARLKAEAEAKRKAEAERRQAQSRADLARQLAEEEHLDAAQGSGLLAQYVDVIRQKVERNWLKPASARSGIECVVQVRQIPGGEVVEVRVTECNGDAAVLRSIEAAVLRSSPLPPPPDPALFERSLEFVFRPED